MKWGAVCLGALALSTGREAAADDPVEVEVRGEAIPAPPKEPSVAGSVIREDRLRGAGLQAGDVLRTQPGVAVMETGGQGSLATPSVRGATAAQTPVYLAGIRLNDDVGGAADLSLAPLWLVHQVEIYRSNAPLAGDELGIGGAIFFELHRPRRTEGAVGVMGGSFGAHALWARAGFGGDGGGRDRDRGWAGLVGVRLEGAFNDYPFVNDSGTRFEPSNFHTVTLRNADTRTIDAWAMGSGRLGEHGRVDIIANDVERAEGLPGLPLFPTRRARVSLRRQLAGVSSRLSCANVGCEVEVTTALVATHARYDDPLREVGLGTSTVAFDAARVENAVLLRWAPSARVAVSPSVRASVERLSIDAADSAPLRAQRLFSRAAVQGEWTPSDWLALRALASAECDGTGRDGLSPWSLPGDATGPSGGDSACNQFEPAGRVGAQLGRRPLAIFATLGRYARVPTLTELYGLSGVVHGNTALQPEAGVSFEAGVRASAAPRGVLRGAAIDLFGFVRTASDLVVFQRNSLGYVRPYNIGSARVSGAELLAEYVPTPVVRLELAATVLDPRNTSSGRPKNDVLPYQSPLSLVPRLELRSPLRAPPLDAVRVSVSYFYESSRFADFAGLVVIPEQGSLDIEAEIAALGRDRFTLRARVANLLDQTRFDLIGYPLPGRAAYVALEAQW